MSILTPGLFLADLNIAAVFTGPAPVRADTAELVAFSPGDVVEHMNRPGKRLTITKVWTDSDGSDLIDVRDESGRVLSVFRSWLRPVLQG